MQFYHLIYQIWASSWPLFFLYVFISLPACSSSNILHSFSTTYEFPWYIIFVLLRTSSFLLLLLPCSFCLHSKCSWWKPWWSLKLLENILLYLYRKFTKKTKVVIISGQIPATFWRSWQNIDRQPKRQNLWFLW